MRSRNGMLRTIATLMVSGFLCGCQTVSTGMPHPFTTLFYEEQPAAQKSTPEIGNDIFSPAIAEEGSLKNGRY